MMYKKLDLYSCQGQFFGPPPKPNSRRERYGAFVVNTLNGAFCDFYKCATPPRQCHWVSTAPRRMSDGPHRCSATLELTAYP
eukprot:6193320-Pleurochrysis_carterae.AAC.3